MIALSISDATGCFFFYFSQVQSSSLGRGREELIYGRCLVTVKLTCVILRYDTTFYIVLLSSLRGGQSSPTTTKFFFSLCCFLMAISRSAFMSCALKFPRGWPVSFSFSAGQDRLYDDAPSTYTKSVASAAAVFLYMAAHFFICFLEKKKTSLCV